MKKQILNIFLSLLVMCLVVSPSLAEQLLNVGLILDGDNMGHVRPILQKELNDLLQHKAQVLISDDNVVVSNWSKENSKNAYEKLVESEDIDIIISVGVVSSEVISNKESYLKPTICYGAKRAEAKDSVPNFAYISASSNVIEQFSELKKVYPYKKLAVVNILNNAVTSKKLHTDDIVQISLNDLMSTIDTDKSIDAVYLGYLGENEGAKKKELISHLLGLGYPVFGFSQEDLKNGAYAICTSDSNLIINIKNIAMIVDNYIDGMDISKYEPAPAVKGHIALNLQSARKLHKMPSYEVLRDIVVYNEHLSSKVQPIDVKQAILYALENNLDLSSNKIKSQIAQRELQLSKRNFAPSITVGPSLFFIDDSFSNLVHERSGFLNASFNQLIYSDKVISNIVASENLLKAQDYQRTQSALSAVKTASQAYLNILKAQNRQNVLANILEFSRTNLDMKEKAQKLGAISMSDVYRWRSEYAMNKNNYIASKNSTQQAMLALNNILNKPIDTVFVPVDISLGSKSFVSFENQQIKKVVDDPVASEDFADFLTEKALKENPILKASASRIKANERLVKYFKRKNLLPTVGIRSSLFHGMFESGKGPSEGGDDLGYMASVSANWEIFDGDKSRMNLKKSRLELDGLKVQKKKLENNIEYAVRSGVIDLVSKSANIDLSGRSADYAKKNLDLVQKSYDIGKVSIIELLNAKNAESKAQMQYLDSVYDYLISVIGLQSQVGTYNILSSSEEQGKLYEDFQKYLQQKESL